MKTIRILGASALFASAMALAACDSAAENDVESQAEAIDENSEAVADSMRDSADGTAVEGAVDSQADAIEAEGEATKDAMEDQADEMDNGTPQ
ncbi:MAG: hypothetical protein ABIT10_05055 [Alteraurantiacibacter sp.]